MEGLKKKIALACCFSLIILAFFSLLGVVIYFVRGKAGSSGESTFTFCLMLLDNFYALDEKVTESKDRNDDWNGNTGACSASSFLIGDTVTN